MPSRSLFAKSGCFFFFCRDLNWVEKGAWFTDNLQPQGVEGLLISSSMQSLAGQNALLAAELGLWWSHQYGSVTSQKKWQSFNPPDSPICLWDTLGVPNQNHDEAKTATENVALRKNNEISANWVNPATVYRRDYAETRLLSQLPIEQFGCLNQAQLEKSEQKKLLKVKLRPDNSLPL